MKKTIVILIAVLFTCFYAGTTLFYHSHLVAGKTVYHSHPYAGDPEEHSHSKDEFILIDLITSSVFLVIVAGTASLTFSNPNPQQTSGYNVPALTNLSRLSFSLRAPPKIS